MMNPKFSILIVNYRSEDWLKSCLESLFKYHPNLNYEVLIADNGSDLKKRQVLQDQFGQAFWVLNDSNLGFAKGANQVAQKALGQYLVFLNPDCRFTGEVLYSLLAEMEMHEEISVSAPLLRNEKGLILENGGEYPGFFEGIVRLTHLNFYFVKKSNQKMRSKIQYKEWISGACLAIRKKDFIEIEGWDERFFLYLEDVALCYNVREKLKKEICIIPIQGIIHNQSRSVQSDPFNEVIWIERFKSWVTYLRYYKKHSEPIISLFKRMVMWIERIKLIVYRIKKMSGYGKRETLFRKLCEETKRV